LTQIFKSRACENAGKLINLAVIDARTLEPLMETVKSQFHKNVRHELEM